MKNVSEEKPLREKHVQASMLPEINRIFPVLPSMLRKYDRLSGKDRFRGNSPEEFTEWQSRSVELLKELLGLEKMEACGLHPEITEIPDYGDGICREHLTLETDPGIFLTALLLIPERAGRETPVVICPSGHGGAGKYSIAGESQYVLVQQAIQKYNYDVGLQVARMGYVAVCPDARGFGERREELSWTRDPELAMKGDCYWLAHMGEPLGIPVMGMLVWDLCRLMDYLVDRNQWKTDEGVGLLGFSGGGMQALYFGAVDPRIQGMLISGYMYGFKDSLIGMYQNCSCNYIPHLMEHFDMGDIAGMCCPKKMIIQTGSEDRLNGAGGIENVRGQVNIAESAYRAAGQENRIQWDVHFGNHQFYSENLQKNLGFLFSQSI